jgi:hypothetical protein
MSHYILSKSWPNEMQTFIKYILTNKCEVTFDESTNILFFPTKNSFVHLWNTVLNKDNSYPTISRSFSNYKIKALYVKPSANIFKFLFPPYFHKNTLLVKHYVNLFGDDKSDSENILEEEGDKDEEEPKEKDEEGEKDEEEPKEKDEEGEIDEEGEEEKEEPIKEKAIHIDNIRNIIKFNKYITKMMISNYKKKKHIKTNLIFSNLKNNNKKLNKLIYNVMELVIS